jgi:hypothetical protein
MVMWIKVVVYYRRSMWPTYQVYAWISLFGSH